MKHFIAISTIALLTACGGGGGSGSPVDISGTYIGSFTTAGSEPSDLAGIFDPRGEFRMFSFDGGRIYAGRINGDPSDFVGSLTSYDIVNETDFSLLALRSEGGSLSGAVTLGGNVSGTFSSSNSGQVGSFSLEPLGPPNEAATDISAFEGLWGNSDSLTGDAVGLTIQANGSFSGSDSDGCNYTGRISPARPDIGIFAISLNAACPGLGAFNANGLLEYLESESGDSFTAIISSSQRAVLLELLRV